MPGMDHGASLTAGPVLAAFHSALAKQGIIALGILLAVLVATNIVRTVRLRRALRDGPAGLPPALAPEPAARQLLRYGFGVLWILDGLLQLQSAIPLGMVSQVVQPAASGSPSWVHTLVNAGGTIWNDHPVTAAAATVWIQIGLGAWLLIAPRGLWSRAAGAASASWAVLVWIFGEAFGGIFAPGASWLFGAPGAVAFYAVAGVLLALPEEVLRSRSAGRYATGGFGLFFVGMGVLQAWPGRGSWRDGRLGLIPRMLTSMKATRQPGAIHSIISGFASFTWNHDVVVNAVAVVALVGIGVGLVSGRPGMVRAAVLAAVVLCVADWVLVQDMGFFGGTGTDPNSMIPMAILLVGSYLALVAPTTAPATVNATMPEQTKPAAAGGRRVFPLTALAAAGAVAIVSLGALPMAVAAVSPGADALLTESINGTPLATSAPAPSFLLTDQNGKQVSLSSLRGKVVVLTFLDPVCTVDCPLIASELKQADEELGLPSRSVEFVAIDANPIYHTRAATDVFDRTEGLATLPNWLYLSGPEPTLRHIWNSYGVQVIVEPDGSMIAHNDILYVVNASGRIRDVLNSDPGPGTAAYQASFSSLLVSAVRRYEAPR